jgi:hypothetical protein
MSDARNADSVGHYPPQLWSRLSDPESGDCAIVVQRDTTPLDALLTLIEEETGDRFDPNNPFLVKEAATATVEVWRSCSKRWREDEGVDPCMETWWAPDGDGKRWCYVVSSIRSPWVLAELAEAALPPNGS